MNPKTARMSSSTNASTLSNDEEKRDWLDLPSDITANILHRIGVHDILKNAQEVCIAWRKICEDDPAMWRVIKIIWSYERNRYKQIVDRSQGQLVDISILSPNDKLLSYVADRSRCLRRLEIAFSLYMKVDRRLHEVLMKFPLLEELNLYSAKMISSEDIETVGHCCPMLKTLKVNQKAYNHIRGYRDDSNVAIAVGKNLHELRHLELIGSGMSNEELRVILDGCRHLETLDLRDCWNIDLINGDLRKRCFEHIKHLKLPNDSLDDCPYPLY